MPDGVLSKQFLETIPRAMRIIRFEMRKSAKSELSVTQFRALAQLQHSKATNGELAENLGLSPPNMSRMTSELLKRRLVRQVRSKEDRRQLHLELTSKGREKFEAIRSRAQIHFDREFSQLSPERRKSLQQGLEIIQSVFQTEKVERGGNA